MGMVIAVAFALGLSGAFAAELPTAASPAPVYGPPAPVPLPAHKGKTGTDACRSQNSRDVVVCAQRRQTSQLDPDVSDAQRKGEKANRRASTARPTAQASCSTLPQGCGTGLAGLDLANVAIVLGTMAVQAVKGEDWKKSLRTGGPDEYQLYLQAKQEREAREELARAQAAAANARLKSR
jgi:hypothetical protein